MRVVLLMGGIGNRLFQLARAHDLRCAGHDPVVVAIEDVPELDGLASRVLGWTRHPLWADMHALAAAIGLHRREIGAAGRLALLAELARSRLPAGKARFNLPLDVDRRIAQVGYFQARSSITPASVETVSTALAGLLPLASHPAHPAVIHVRGGDFAQEDRLAPDSVAAFQAAAGRACLGVTNDPAHVRARFPELRLAPSTGPRDDFMTLCNARQILPSNSTFCFWACSIATRRSGATLWQRPRDAYWDLLDATALTSESTHAV